MLAALCLKSMKIRDFGKVSMQTSFGAWSVGIIFTFLSWWSVGVAYSDHQPGDPKPESLLLEIFPIIAFLAFPISIIATIFGLIALFRAHSRTKAIVGIITSVPLFSFLGLGFWVAVNGGV